jgi:hypothetical protein
LAPSSSPVSPELIATDPGQDAAVVDARHLLVVSRSLHPSRSWMSLAQTVYTTALALGIAGVLFWSFWKQAASFLTAVASPYQVLWGTSAVALVILAAVRYSTLQGFVSYSEADCFLLLTAPVPRRELIQPRLRRVAIGAAIGGAIVGVLATMASGGIAAGAVAMVEGLVAGAALGIIVVVAGWHVQRLRGASTWITRLTLPALGLVALLAFAEWKGGAAHLAALWSGPWGWGLLPLGASGWASGLAGVLLLCALATAGWFSVRRSAGDAAVEGFLIRAQTRSQVVAGLYAFDARSVVLAARQPWGQRWRAHLRFRPPRWPILAVPWHGSLMLLRSPMRLGWAVALAGAGALLLGVQPGRTGTSWAGAVALYLSASSLVEPLRLEVDSAATSAILLPWQLGKVLWRHCLVPVAVLFVTGLVATLIGWAAGFVATSTLPALSVLAIPAVFTVVLAVALSARRGGRLPQSILLLSAGDTTGFSVFTMVAWVFGWTILAIVLVAVAARVLVSPSPLWGTPSLVAGGLAVVAVVLWSVLVRSKR